MNRGFKGVWIPKELWLNKELTWMEKLMLAEIDSLDNDDGCYASNGYLGPFFQISTTRVSQIVSSLKKKGYISVRYEREGKEIKRRVLNILKGGIKYTKGGYLENCKDITNINNINIEWGSLHEKIEQVFLDNIPDEKMYQYGKERKAIKRLVELAEKSEDAELYIFSLLKAFWILKNSSDRFWQDRPYLPSVLMSKGIIVQVQEKRACFDSDEQIYQEGAF